MVVFYFYIINEQWNNYTLSLYRLEKLVNSSRRLSLRLLDFISNNQVCLVIYVVAYWQIRNLEITGGTNVHTLSESSPKSEIWSSSMSFQLHLDIFVPEKFFHTTTYPIKITLLAKLTMLLEYHQSRLARFSVLFTLVYGSNYQVQSIYSHLEAFRRG